MLELLKVKWEVRRGKKNVEHRTLNVQRRMKDKLSTLNIQYSFPFIIRC